MMMKKIPATSVLDDGAGPHLLRGSHEAAPSLSKGSRGFWNLPEMAESDGKPKWNDPQGRHSFQRAEVGPFYPPVARLVAGPQLSYLPSAKFLIASINCSY